MNLGNMWIVVPNWDTFQHYKDRNPVWIRTYVDLLDRPEYIDLSPTEQGLLHRVWLLYARTNGQLRIGDVTGTLHARHRHAARTAHFESLNHAGFIELSASRPFPQRQRQRQRQKEPFSKEVTSAVDVANSTGFQFSKENLVWP